MSASRPGGGQLAALIWIAVLGVVVIGPPLYDALGLWGLVVGQLGLILLPSLLVARGRPEWLGLQPAGIGRFAGALLCGWSLARLVTLLLGWQQRWLPLPEQLDQAYARLGEQVAERPLLALLALALLPALCEETLFRGLVLRWLLHSRGSRVALLGSSALFVLVHLDPYKLPSTALAGLTLGALALRSGSVLPSMLLHLSYNGTLLLAPEPSAPTVLAADLPLLALGLWLGLRPQAASGAGAA